MNFIDILIIVPLLWGGYKGFTKGLVVEVSTLVALLLGIWGSIKFSGITSDFLINNFNFTDKYVPTISFAITFIGIVIAVHFVAKLITKLVKAVSLNFVNKIIGAAFGALKFGFILSIIIIIFDKLDNEVEVVPHKLKSESLLYYPVSKISTTVFPSLKNFKTPEINVPINPLNNE